MIRDLQFTLKNICLILVACFILSSCHNDNKNNSVTSPYFTAFFTNSNDAVLRGVNFNMHQDEVKNIEQSRSYEVTPDHLFYIFSFPTDSTAFAEYANIQYSFNENNQLDVITNDIYLNDTIQQIQLRNTLTDYLNDRFGDADIKENKDEVWTSSYKDNSINKKYTYTITVKKLEDEEDENAIGLTIEYYLER